MNVHPLDRPASSAESDRLSALLARHARMWHSDADQARYLAESANHWAGRAMRCRKHAPHWEGAYHSCATAAREQRAQLRVLLATRGRGAA